MDALSFRCTGCGNCCRNLRVALTALDVKRLAAATGKATPTLVEWLAPDTVDMSGEPGSFGALKACSSIQSIYQVHRNVRVGPELNTAPELTANTDEKCTGNHIKLSVDPDGKRYALHVPATNHEKTYDTRKK